MGWGGGSWGGGKGGKDQGKGGKGKSFGPPPVNWNVADLDKACIDKLPSSGVAVFQGRPEDCLEYSERLRQALDEYEPDEVRFDNIDVSKVEWEGVSFSVLLDVLKDKMVITKRFKAFKCG